MLRRATLALLLCSLAVDVAGQQLSRRPAHFAWDYRKAQDLDNRHTLGRDSGLSVADNAAVRRAIGRLQKETLADRDGATLSAKKIVADTRILLIDLNGDGVPEVIASPSGVDGGCGANNCVLWVLQKSEDGYKTILDTSQSHADDAVQTFTIMRSKTGDYYDLTLASHSSATEQELFVYRFGSRGYVAHDCYSAHWPDLWDSPATLRKSPTIAPCERTKEH